MDDSISNNLFVPYNFISENLSSDYILSGTSNIIIEMNSIFFYIEEKKDRIIDVSKMPPYIRLDWLNYNKKELDLKTINQHIKYHKNVLEIFKNSDIILSELIAIRRDIIIKMTLK
jgi:predicted metalloprotease with PDZ domain